MKLFKKAGCILLSFVLLLSMLPMTAFAEPESSLLDGYTELELEWTQGYYNSQGGAKITVDSQFMSTQKFTKVDLPVGTVIVLQPGWTYRPDGWLAGSSYTSKVNRPVPVRLAAAEGATASYVEIDEDWWKVKVYGANEVVEEVTDDEYAERVFVINRNPHAGDVEVADVEAIFKIYVPAAPSHTHAYGTAWKKNATNHWNECSCGEKANTAAHADANLDGKCDVCAYQIATNNDNPQTGDNSMITLWVALLCVSAFGIFVTTIYRKKSAV